MESAASEKPGAAKVVVAVEQLLDTTIYKGPSAEEKEKESSGAVGESARVVDNYLQLFPGPAGIRKKVSLLLLFFFFKLQIIIYILSSSSSPTNPTTTEFGDYRDQNSSSEAI